jgi:hypothetical protein
LLQLTGSLCERVRSAAARSKATLCRLQARLHSDAAAVLDAAGVNALARSRFTSRMPVLRQRRSIVERRRA